MPEVLGTRCTCLVCFTKLMSMKKFVPPTDQREVDEMYREMLSRVEQGILLVPSTRARIEQAIVEKHKAKDMKAVRALAVKMSLLRRQELCLIDQKMRLEERLNGCSINSNTGIGLAV